MGGIFGIIDPKKQNDISKMIDRMGSLMSHQKWYVVDTHKDLSRGVGIGRVGIGGFNKEKQPFQSADNNIVGFLHGEFFNSEEIQQSLKKKAPSASRIDDLDLALRLYEEYGEGFIPKLEGRFVLVIWDKSKNELMIANDFLGHHAVIYAHFGGKFLFAPEMKGIFCDLTVPKKMSTVALAEYMRFQQVLGEKTFFEGLYVLPYASILKYNAEKDTLKIKSYWNFSDISERKISYDDAVEEFGRLLKHAVNRHFPKGRRVGIFLSGGLDSRAILSMIDPQNYPVITVSYGQKKCRDMVYGARAAKKAGSLHNAFEISDGNWVKDNIDLHLNLTEGFHNWTNADGLSILPQVRPLIDVNLSGHGSGATMGAVRTIISEPIDKADFLGQAFELFTKRMKWNSLTEADEEFLYTEPWKKEIRGMAFSSFAQEISRFEDSSFSRQMQAFRTYGHSIRSVNNFLFYMDSYFENATPYMENRLAKFGFSLPAKMKKGKRLLRSLISRKFHKLAMIPYDKDNLLVTEKKWLWNTHFVWERLRNRFNRHVFPLFPDYPTLALDYDEYLRSDLQEWGKNLLLGKKTLERGIFNPSFLRSIWARQQSGMELNILGKIAPIMTYEMVLRRFYD
jgi:asparagine synthase (glutamine-hydrolysing)